MKSFNLLKPIAFLLSLLVSFSFSFADEDREAQRVLARSIESAFNPIAQFCSSFKPDSNEDSEKTDADSYNRLCENIAQSTQGQMDPNLLSYLNEDETVAGTSRHIRLPGDPSNYSDDNFTRALSQTDIGLRREFRGDRYIITNSDADGNYVNTRIRVRSDGVEARYRRSVGATGSR